MLSELICSAWKGRRTWLKVCKDIPSLPVDTLIIMPDDDPELNVCAIKNMDAYLKKHFYNSAVVLIADYGERYDVTAVTDKADVRYLPQEIVEAILCYYRFIPFCRAIKVISLRAPYGSRGLLNKEGVDIDYMTVNYIYR